MPEAPSTRKCVPSSSLSELIVRSPAPSLVSETVINPQLPFIGVEAKVILLTGRQTWPGPPAPPLAPATTMMVTVPVAVWPAQSMAANVTTNDLSFCSEVGVKRNCPFEALKEAFAGTPDAESVTAQPGEGELPVTVNTSV